VADPVIEARISRWNRDGDSAAHPLARVWAVV